MIVGHVWKVCYCFFIEIRIMLCNFIIMSLMFNEFHILLNYFSTDCFLLYCT